MNNALASLRAQEQAKEGNQTIKVKNENTDTTGDIVEEAKEVQKIQEELNANKKDSNSEVKSKENKPSIGGAAKSLWGKYGMKTIKGAGDFVLGTGLGATGAMIGFASGVAQGDLGKALSGAAAGGTAGYGLGKGTINGAINTVKNTKQALNNIEDTFNEGAYGKEEAQNMKELREFKGTSTYKSLIDKYGDNLTDDKLKAMLEAGIKDKGDIEKVLKSDNTSDAIGYYTLAKKCPDGIYYDDDKLQMYLEDLGLSQTDAKIMRENMREFR